jgi:hypothetical protein
MTQTLFIPGPLPRLNELIGRERWYYKNAKKQWGETIGWEIRRQHLRPMDRVFIRWIWQEKDQRQDPDNFCGIGKKFALDALVATGILKNDGWKQLAGWTDTWVVVPVSPARTVTTPYRDD